MKSAIAIICSLLSLTALAQQSIEPLKLDELNELINEDSDKLKVINFWASWCGPCVKEMPYFDEVGKDANVEVYFISLDFPKDKAKAEKLINKVGIISTTYLLDEKDYDKYISSINNNWSGAIPATLFIDKEGKRTFYEQALEQHELQEIVRKLTSK